MRRFFGLLNTRQTCNPCIEKPKSQFSIIVIKNECKVLRTVVYGAKPLAAEPGGGTAVLDKNASCGATGAVTTRIGTRRIVTLDIIAFSGASNVSQLGRAKVA